MREFTHEDARDLVGAVTEEFGMRGIIVIVQRGDGMHVMGSAARKGEDGDQIRGLRDGLKEFFRDHGVVVQMPAEAKEDSDA